MSRKNRKYSEEFKLSVLREYYVSGMSKRQCVKQFGLSGHRILTQLQRQKLFSINFRPDFGPPFLQLTEPQ